MFNCFICTENSFSTINLYIWHLKVFHDLGPQSMFTCKQPNCFRDLLGLEKFRQHLKRNHRLDTLNNHSNENIDEIVTDQLNTNVFDQHKVKSIITDTEETFNQNVNSKDGTTFKDVVTRIILKFISKLYLKPNLTSLLIQNII